MSLRVNEREVVGGLALLKLNNGHKHLEEEEEGERQMGLCITRMKRMCCCCCQQGSFQSKVGAAALCPPPPPKPRRALMRGGTSGRSHSSQGKAAGKDAHRRRQQDLRPCLTRSHTHLLLPRQTRSCPPRPLGFVGLYLHMRDDRRKLYNRDENEREREKREEYTVHTPEMGPSHTTAYRFTGELDPNQGWSAAPISE